MINRGTCDRLEDAIDDFEATWSPESQSRIEDLLVEYGLSQSDEAIVELIRIDIELRYERGLSIELDDYLQRFAILHERPDRVAEIAYEDYRSRSASGRPVSATRWRGLPGVNREQWYQELARDATIRRISARAAKLQTDPSADAAFEYALEEAGFHLVQSIGEGAFSHVYLANQLELADRFVVLKIVAESLAEPEYMALLQHTNIVPIYSFHRILTRSVICMPYAGSVTLHDFLQGRSEVSQRGGQSLIQTVRDQIADTKLFSRDEPRAVLSEGNEDRASKAAAGAVAPAAEDGTVMRPLEAFKTLDCGQLALWIFQRLAGALAHAHARGVLHNDLKPSNVLIRNDGEPALLDFNLSLSLGQSRLRHAGGTLPYMSPETYRVMMGQDARPDAASDVYGLGVMLFEFVTARLPFPAPASIAAVDLEPAIEARRSQPLWHSTDKVSDGMKAIINRCLRFEPEDRYASADLLQLDLQREQQSLALVTASEPLSWKLKKWVRRHPRAVASGWALFLLLAIVLPLSLMTVASFQDNRSLRAEADYKAFSDDSVELLSALMADPNRQDDAKISSGVSMLRQYGLLEREGIERLVQSRPSESQSVAREALERHITHLAILETQRLSQLRISDSQTPQDFQRLDQLVDAVGIVSGAAPSRASLFLKSERARLSGNEDRYRVLRRMAENTPAHTDSELYLEAVRRLAAYDHAGASELLAALADRNSVPSALRWTMLGRAQYADRKLEDAKLSFTQSIERAPRSAMLRVLRGRCHIELGEWVNAEKDYRKAIELDPDSVGAWSQLGYLLHLTERDDEALQCFNRSMELAPERIWTRLKRAETYRALGQDDLADADLQTAMTASCDNSNELVYRARALWKQWRASDPDAAMVAEAAVADLRKAHQLDPDRPYPLQEMARILDVGLGRHQEAIEIFSKVLEIQPKNETVLINRALAQMRLGRTKDAINDTIAAMEEPNTGKTLYQAACVHALIGKEANKRRAETLLANAITAGYTPKSLDNDSDLESIRDSEAYRTIARFIETSRRDRRLSPATSDDQSMPNEFQPL